MANKIPSTFINGLLTSAVINNSAVTGADIEAVIDSIDAAIDDLFPIDYKASTDPLTTTNPPTVGATWINTTTGEVFVCFDNTTNANMWRGSLDTPASLLLHFNGANNATTFVDSGRFRRPNPTVFSDARLSTSSFKFGTASGYFSAGDYASWPTWEGLDFGANDFTIDFWVRTDSITQHMGIASTLNAAFTQGSFAIEIDLESDPGTNYRMRLIVVYADGTSANIYVPPTLSASTWYHTAIVRSGSTFTVYIDGVAGGSFSSTKALRSAPNGLVMGRLYTDSNNFYFNGRFDEFRIVKEAVWTSNFTPPNREYLR